MNKTIGTCSICGGPVTAPGQQHGITPPAPTCGKCDSIYVDGYFPIMPMQELPPGVTATYSNGTIH